MGGQEKKDRVILHVDGNNFFASCECLHRPELREVPMAVAGDPESRHGIILAKNQLAKAKGVQTAEPIWQARRKCPGLVLVPPHRETYSRISAAMNRIFLDCTDLVEPASIDESYLDLTGSLHLLGGDPVAAADQIRARVREELGITVSVGVSFCKTFAKLGSDYKKPDATTYFPRRAVPTLIWPMPAGNLLYVGANSPPSSGSWASTPSETWPGPTRHCCDGNLAPGGSRPGGAPTARTTSRCGPTMRPGPSRASATASPSAAT